MACSRGLSLIICPIFFGEHYFFESIFFGGDIDIYIRDYRLSLLSIYGGENYGVVYIGRHYITLNSEDCNVQLALCLLIPACIQQSTRFFYSLARNKCKVTSKSCCTLELLSIAHNYCPPLKHGM